jgi:tetratricopeptide (TPR) repeat protein
LHERRRVLHAQIVKTLETLAGDRIDDYVERLAHHAFRGEVWDKAQAYYRQAGAKAMARSANQEAVTCFEQALNALQHLPERHNTVVQSIDVRLDLRNALLPLGDYKRIFAILRDAERLAEAQDDPYRLGWVSAHLTHYFWSMGDLDRALEYGQRAVALAAPFDDTGMYAIAHFDLAEVHYSLGQYRQAIGAFEQLVARFTGDRLYERIATTVFSVVSRRWLVQTLAETGAFAAGIARGEEGIRVAEVADPPSSLASLSSGFGYLYARKGDFQKAIPLLKRSLELCRVWDLRQIVAAFALRLGYALALSGQASESLALLEQSAETADPTRLIGRRSEGAVMLSEVYWLAGRYEDALALADKAYKLAGETGERGMQAWAERLLGALHSYGDAPDFDRAATHYRHALTLANELGMRPLQAHCHRGLGTLYSQAAQPEQARAELSTAIEMYRDMEMTFWLPETEAALAAVEGKA